MDIKTKYGLDEIVFYLSTKDQVYTAVEGKVKIVEGKIEGIHTNIFHSNKKIDIEYTLRVGSKHIRVNEKFVDKNVRNLFKTVMSSSDENLRIKLNENND